MKYLYLLLLIFTLACTTQTQEQTQEQSQDRGMKPQGGTAPAGTERRLALVVGNKDYQHIRPLRNPTNDANAMEKALKTLGFEVIKVVNTDYRSLVKAVNEFRDRLSSKDVALVYYSGHGVSFAGKNYLLPVDANITCLEQIEEYGLSLNRLLADISAMQVRNSFVFLDACRNLPNLTVCSNTQRDVSPALGLVKPTNNPRGSMVVYATREGSTADDNVSGQNGLFTAALLKYLTTPDVGIRNILDKATLEVEKRSGGQQTPGRYDELRGDFVFVKTVAPSTPSLTTKPARPREDLPKNEPAKVRTYLDLPFAELVRVPGGSFQMGSTLNEGYDSEKPIGYIKQAIRAMFNNEGFDSEKPIHQVTVDGFWMGKYEVTQRQWQEIMGSNPSDFKNCEDCPVENVSWDEVQEFLKKLNARTGGGYRLPTEAEWEYTAGGGSSARTRFGNGKNVADPQEINFNGTADYKKPYSVVGVFHGKTVKVGSFAANALGLHDMTGNVWEWCQDWYSSYTSSSSINPSGPSTGSDRVLRGGSWGDAPVVGRVVYRAIHPPSWRHHNIGFRIVAPQ